jgi:hypothetical protein
VVAVAISNCSSTPDQIPTLVATPTPSGINNHGQVSTISVSATDEKGNPGEGTVVFTSMAGNLTMPQSVMLAGGYAEVRFSCPSSDMNCQGCIDIKATWTTTKKNQVVSTAHVGVSFYGDIFCNGGGVVILGSNGGGCSGDAGMTLACRCTPYNSQGHKAAFGSGSMSASEGDEVQNDTVMNTFDYFRAQVLFANGATVPGNADLAKEAAGCKYCVSLALGCPNPGGAGGPPSGCGAYLNAVQGSFSVSNASMAASSGSFGGSISDTYFDNGSTCVHVTQMGIDSSW